MDAARECGLIESLSKRAAVAVAKFVAMFDRLSLVASAPVEEMLGHVLSESGYRQLLIDSDDEEDQERLANIEELLTAARQFDEKHPGDGALEAFLEEACLVNDTDAWEAEDDRVTLMTLHASKGLEFPVVFIVALEEGLMPHERSRQDEAMLEEERRLLFVGITRAQEELELSLAVYREFRGQRRLTVPSLFLIELPRGEMHMIEPVGEPSLADESEHAHEEPRGRVALGNESATTADDGFVEPPAAIEPTAIGRRRGAPVGDGGRIGTCGRVARARAGCPEAFYKGWWLSIREYGLGKVVALSGNGPRRSATVAFASPAGQKRFMLMHSDLRPIKNG